MILALIAHAFFAAAPLFAAPPCELSAADYEALAHAVKQPSGREAVDAMDGKDAKNLCAARAFVGKLRRLAGDKAKITGDEVSRIAGQFADDELPAKMSRYTTAEEWELAKPVVSSMLARMFDGKLAPSDKPLPPPPSCSLASLEDSDYDALSRVEAPFTRDSVAALSAKDQQALCLGRRLVRLTRQGDAKALSALTLSDIPSGYSRFMTQEESRAVSGLISKILAADAAGAVPK